MPTTYHVCPLCGKKKLTVSVDIVSNDGAGEVTLSRFLYCSACDAYCSVYEWAGFDEAKGHLSGSFQEYMRTIQAPKPLLADLPQATAHIHFEPQAWLRDYAISVDPEGDTEFEIPLDCPDLWYKDGQLVEDHSYESDELRSHPNAPEWIRNWSGPFDVEITNRDEIEAQAK